MDPGRALVAWILPATCTHSQHAIPFGLPHYYTPFFQFLNLAGPYLVLPHSSANLVSSSFGISMDPNASHTSFPVVYNSPWLFGFYGYTMFVWWTDAHSASKYAISSDTLFQYLPFVQAKHTKRSWRRRHRTRTTIWGVFFTGFTSKCGPSAMSSSPRSSSSSRYHEVNKKEVSKKQNIVFW